MTDKSLDKMEIKKISKGVKRIHHIGVCKKIGMTRIFNQEGKSIPVTALEWTPAYVLKVDNKKQTLLIAYNPKNRPAKPILGQIKKAGISEKLSQIREFKTYPDAKFKTGEKLNIKQFKIKDKITSISITKGKGFTGVIKRHGFSRGPESHGSHHHRAPGSIGSMYPQRVIAGRKMPGQSGGTKITIKNLKIEDINEEKQILLIHGSIAGPNQTQVLIFN